MRHETLWLAFAVLLTFSQATTAWSQRVPGPGAGLPAAAASGRQGYDLVQMGADPTGARDSTEAWNAACRLIPPGGQGKISLPPGDYRAESPWVCDGRALYVAGEAEGVTRIHATHGGTVLSFTPGDLQRRTTIERLSVVSDASCMTDTGIAVHYPQSLSYLLRTLTVRDVEIVSSTAPTTGCHPSSIRRGLVLDGVWNGLVERVSINGPYALPPVPGTVGVEIGSYGVAIHLNEVAIYTTEIGVDLSGYVEGIFLQTPTLVAVGTGFRAGRKGASRHPDTGQSALSLVFRDGECAVFLRCIDWTDVATGYVYANRMSQQPDGPGADRFISLATTKLVLVTNNSFMGDPRHATVAMASTGTSTLNRLDGNQCLNVPGCVAFGVGTTSSTAINNQQNVPTHNGFTDLGANNITIGIATKAGP